MNSTFEVTTTENYEDFPDDLHMENVLYASDQGPQSVGFEADCNICFEKLFCLQLYQQHMLKHENYIYECDICYARFQEVIELERHENEVHIVDLPGETGIAEEHLPIEYTELTTVPQYTELTPIPSRYPETTNLESISDPLRKLEQCCNELAVSLRIKAEFGSIPNCDLPETKFNPEESINVINLVCKICNINVFDNWGDFEEHTLIHISLPKIELTRLSKKELKRYKVPLRRIYKSHKKNDFKYTITVNQAGGLKIARKKACHLKKEEMLCGEVQPEIPETPPVEPIPNGEVSVSTPVNNTTLDCEDALKERLCFLGITINAPAPITDSKDFLSVTETTEEVFVSKVPENNENHSPTLNPILNGNSPSETEKDSSDISGDISENENNMAPNPESMINDTDMNATLDNLHLQSSKPTVSTNMLLSETEFISLDSLAGTNAMSPAVPVSSPGGTTGSSTMSSVPSPVLINHLENGMVTQESPIAQLENMTSPVETIGTSERKLPEESVSSPSSQVDPLRPDSNHSSGYTSPPNTDPPKQFTAKVRFSSWNCNTCQRPFNTPEELSTHLKTDHGAPPQDQQMMPQQQMPDQSMQMQQPSMHMSQQQPMQMQDQQQQYGYHQSNMPQMQMSMNQMPMQSPQMQNQQLPMPPMVRIPRQALGNPNQMGMMQNNMMQNQGMQNGMQMPLRQQPPPPYHHQYMNHNMPRQNFQQQSNMQQMYQQHPNQQHMGNNSILAQSLQRPPPLGNTLMGQQRNMPNLMAMNQQGNHSQQMIGQKRPGQPMRQMPQQKMQRSNVEIPARQNDKECEIIAVQKRTEGLPIIQNVQGASSPAPSSSPSKQQSVNSESTIHLSDSITLSRCSGAEQARPQQSSDASKVTTLLATRGITVTPAAGSNNNNRRNQQQTAQQQQTQAALATMQLNSSISISTTGENNSNAQNTTNFAVPSAPARNNTSQPVTRPPRPPTVDLTQDAPVDVPPHPMRRPMQNRQMGNQRFTCYICDKQYPTSEILKQHMTCHQTSSPQKLPYRCNLCNASYPNMQQLQQHKQQYHKETGGNTSELVIPIVDLKNPSTVNNLTRMGITAFVPVSQLQNTGNGNFGIPLVLLDPSRPLYQNHNLKALEASGILPMGQMRMISHPR